MHNFNVFTMKAGYLAVGGGLGEIHSGVDIGKFEFGKRTKQGNALLKLIV